MQLITFLPLTKLIKNLPNLKAKLVLLKLMEQFTVNTEQEAIQNTVGQKGNS